MKKSKKLFRVALIWVFTSFFLTKNSNAQTYIGFSFGPGITFKNTSLDPEGNIGAMPSIVGEITVLGGYHFKEHWSVETMLTLAPYTSRAGIANPEIITLLPGIRSGTSGGINVQTWINARYSRHIYNGFYFASELGFGISMYDSEYGSCTSGSLRNNNLNSGYLLFFERVKPWNPSIRAKLAFEKELKPRLKINFGVVYSQSLVPVWNGHYRFWESANIEDLGLACSFSQVPTPTEEPVFDSKFRSFRSGLLPELKFLIQLGKLKSNNE